MKGGSKRRMKGDSLPKISVVVPCYNEAGVIRIFLKAVVEVAASMPSVIFEYIFVDDGSRDQTLPILRELSDENDAVRYI